MKYIAHRGLVNGPDKQLENNPDQIHQSLAAGYDCEIDLWHVNGELYLGHDEPTYPIDRDFLREVGLWVHAKNLAAFRYLLDTSNNYFWHENDAFTLTSHNYIWTFPGQELTQRSVMVMPEHVDTTLQNAVNANCFAICSDFVEKIKNERNQKN
jgi:hypothetical protein